MTATPRPELAGLHVADPPERWRELGFSVKDARTIVGGITIRLGGPGHGITAWAIRNAAARTHIAGLPTAAPSAPCPAPATTHPNAMAHPNTAIAIDHVVVVTPDFDGTAAAFEQAQMPLRRIRDAGSFRQGFRRLGPAILELVEAKGSPETRARFWGLVITVSDLEALAVRLGDHLGAPRRAVQPGRSIATLRDSAGLSAKVAFMDPEPRSTA